MARWSRSRVLVCTRKSSPTIFMRQHYTTITLTHSILPTCYRVCKESYIRPRRRDEYSAHAAPQPRAAARKRCMDTFTSTAVLRFDAEMGCALGGVRSRRRRIRAGTGPSSSRVQRVARDEVPGRFHDAQAASLGDHLGQRLGHARYPLLRLLRLEGRECVANIYRRE